jgi:glycosyltransferase involved in cell wall biosynthesis
MMPRGKQQRIALIWSQFAACHADRCLAVAQRLDGRARVLAVEVATTSREYSATAPSGVIPGVDKRTLFPGRAFESVPRWRRAFGVLLSVLPCRVVFIGIPYSHLEFLLLAWILRLLGKRVVLLIDSKFDDKPRRASFEYVKGLALSGYDGAITASARSIDYLHFLGFHRRPVLPGCDGVSLERVRSDARLAGGDKLDFAERGFVFAGRFIAVKNLELLIEAYARYVELAGPEARRLHLAGSGPLEAELRRRVAALGLEDRVIFAGFLTGPDFAGLLNSSLALVLSSYSETWGMVVNEALALELPVLVTSSPGSRDALVRNLVNGYVVENGSREGLARAMLALGADKPHWQAMRRASGERAWLGDVERFADAVELLLDPTVQPAATQVAANLAAYEELRGGLPQPRP